MKKLVQFYFLLICILFPIISQADIIITEIADPNDDDGCRYIEIHNSGGSSVALTDYYLIRWTNGNANATNSSAIDLSSYTLATGAFLILAKSSSGFAEAFEVGSNTTLVNQGSGGPADSNGDDNHAIVTEASGQTFAANNSSTWEYVDIFGNPGTDGSGNWHEFEDGRAERVSTQISGVTSSSSSAWNCWSDSELFLAGVDQNAGNSLIESTTNFSSNGFDPGAWDGYRSVSISGNSGFRMMSSPVAGQIYSDLLAELWTQGMTGADVTDGTANVWTLNVSGQSWTALTDISGSGGGASQTAGTGFLVYVFDDTDWDGDSDLPVSLSVSGSENSSSASLGSIADGEYGLAGNPYAATIDWDLVTKTAVSTTISVWDDANSDWKTYNTSGSSGDLTGGHIEPYQGFWIRASGGTGSITIETADRCNSSGTFYRTLDGGNMGRMVFNASSDGHSSSNYLSFYEGGTIGVDDGESELLLPFQASSRVVMMSVVEGDAHKISSYPYDHEGSVSVPFDVMRLTLDETSYVTVAEEATLTWDLEELPDHISMTLTDNITGSETYLDYESEYMFTTEPKGSFSATYDGPIGTYPVVGEPRFTLSVTYGALGQNDDATLPSDFALHPVYPNPFNPSATISFDIPDVSLVALNVYDVKGALVETLLQENMKPGKHHYNWEPQVLSSGVYFMKLTTANKSFTQKVTYIK
jgi:hypothetical protein